MAITLKQACSALSSVAQFPTQSDLVSAINRALDSLSGYQAWSRCRKVIRVRSVGPYFSLPQDAASVVRACVNGTPSTVHSQDYRFLSSGPGDLTEVPTGFQRLDPGVVDLGLFPTYRDLTQPSVLAVDFSEGCRSRTKVIVVGHDSSGKIIREELTPVKSDSLYVGKSEKTFSDITSVVLTDDSSTTYLTLRAYPSITENTIPDEGLILGSYHPKITVPEFHRYMVPGVRPDQAIDLLCEVRINNLPLVDMNDVLPLPFLDPIEHMILSSINVSIGEITAAEKLRELAVGELAMNQATEERKQTFTVVNSLYPLSPGEMSDRYAML